MRFCIGRNIRVSIHAPRVEGDPYPHLNPYPLGQFQSTPPGWRATLCFVRRRFH